jgi:DNA-binding LacI/PurR family transcriptional regulator
MKGIDIAKLYNVSKHTIYRILSGKSFKYIK